jgi:hypothetical protein
VPRLPQSSGAARPNKALELPGHRSACRAVQLPAAGHDGMGGPGRLTGSRPMGRGTFTGRQLNADPLGCTSEFRATRLAWVRVLLFSDGRSR